MVFIIYRFKIDEIIALIHLIQQLGWFRRHQYSCMSNHFNGYAIEMKDEEKVEGRGRKMTQ